MQQVRDKLREKFQSYSDAKVIKNSDQDELAQIQKSRVLQDSKCFNDSQLNVRICRQLLSRLIYLINQGETFSDIESQNLFFSITKLFQHENKDLRRMIYLMIKEFRLESSIYIITASLIKDIQSKQDLFRMNALRTIPIVLDNSNLVQVERYIKTALIDKNYAVSSAALLSGIQLYQINGELVKKWQTEVMEKLGSKFIHNHFHAIVLLHEIKKADRNSFTKVLTKCLKENYKQLATIQMIRFCKEILQQQEVDEGTEQLLVDYLNRQSHKSNEAIVFEACRALCDLKHLSNSELSGVVSVISMFLQSLNNVNRFMTLKIINKLVSNPIRRSLISNTSEIENILSDSNKSLSSLAVSILLKLCQENNIEKQLAQIYENLADMSDDFKIDILRSIKQLIKQVPKRAKTVLTFLRNCLKAEGTYDFKKQAVDIIEMMISDIPEVKEQALNLLAEYIEDCQYQYLQLQVLSILNRETSKKAAPTKIIRFINNRIHLEEPEIRAAAVGIIGKFGQEYPPLKNSMINLLKQTLNDPDEEVRERGFFHMQNLEQNEQDQAAGLMKDLTSINLQQLDQIQTFVENNLENLQDCEDDQALNMENIQNFAEQNKNLFKEKQYDIQEKDYYEEEEQQFANKQSNESNKAEIESQNQETKDRFTKYYDLFSQHKIFQTYGPLRTISSAVSLTEKDSEYQVVLFKFFFDDHIVLEYQVKNIVDDRVLRNVKVEVAFDSENIKELHSIPAEEIQFEQTSNILVGVARNPEEKVIPALATNILHFTIEELDAQGKVASSYEDEFQIEDFNITVSEYFKKLPLEKGKFQLFWDGLKEDPESSQYLLHYQNTDFTVKEVVKHLGMSVCDGTDRVKVPNKPHQLLLSGVYLGTHKVLVQIMTAFDSNRGGCPLKIQVKSADSNLSECIASCIQQ